MKKINIGIVGCGDISRVHLTSLGKIKECSIVAVCDLVKERAKRVVDLYGIPVFYTDFSTMLEEEKFDVLYILTNPQSHLKLSIQAMEAGCHVLVEKPMAITLKEADEMVATSRENNVKLCVSHSFIHTPSVLKARELVRTGSLGELIEVNTVVSIDPLLTQKHPQWIYDLPGGIFGEIIPHGLYTVLAFLKSIDRVHCFSRGNSVKEGVPFRDMSVSLFSEKGLGRLLLTSGLSSSFTVVWLNIIGSKASLTVTIPSGSIVKKRMKGNSGRSFRAMMNLSPAWQLIKGTVDMGLKALSGQMHRYVSYEYLSKAFIGSVRGLRESPVTPEEGREVVKVTEMIWKELDIIQ